MLTRNGAIVAAILAVMIVVSMAYLARLPPEAPIHVIGKDVVP